MDPIGAPTQYAVRYSDYTRDPHTVVRQPDNPTNRDAAEQLLAAVRNERPGTDAHLVHHTPRGWRVAPVALNLDPYAPDEIVPDIQRQMWIVRDACDDSAADGGVEGIDYPGHEHRPHWNRRALIEAGEIYTIEQGQKVAL